MEERVKTLEEKSKWPIHQQHLVHTQAQIVGPNGNFIVQREMDHAENLSLQLIPDMYNEFFENGQINDL